MNSLQQDCLVSIIVPVYKTDEDYLRQCIDSLVNQTYKNIEVLLVDDGTPDNGGVICDEYSARFPVVKSIHQENQGVSVARNHGMSLSQGEYLMFVDADDWLELDCVEKVLSECIKRQVDVLFFQRIFEYEGYHKLPDFPDSHPIQTSDFKDITLSILRGERDYKGIDCKPPWGKIIKASVCKENDVIFPIGVRKAQDVIFNCYLFEYMKSASYISYTGYHYRQSDTSVNHRYNPQMPEIMMHLLTEAEKFVNKYHPNDPDYLAALGERALSVLSTIEVTYTFHKDSKMTRKETIKVTQNFLHSDVVERLTNSLKVSDMNSFKRKIRYILEKPNSLVCYYYFMKFIKYRDRSK